MRDAAMIVLAKEPVAGQCKTRLCPPCTQEEAALLARAALEDTLRAVAAAPAPRRVLVLDGKPGDWLPAGFEVLPQRGDGLDERLANAFADVGGPAVLVGMDTPQLRSGALASAGALLRRRDVDAVLGPAADGGYWCIGLKRPRRGAFVGVPMSSAATCVAQRDRLGALGVPWTELPQLRDVDDIDDARAVAAAAPHSRFAAALRELGLHTTARPDVGRGSTAAQAAA